MYIIYYIHKIIYYVLGEFTKPWLRQTRCARLTFGELASLDMLRCTQHTRCARLTMFAYMDFIDIILYKRT